MGLTGSIILFFIIWWLILFIALPININNNAEKLKNDGNDPGAPNNPQILKKFVITTFISLILWAIMYWLLSDDGFLMYVLKSFYIDEIN